MKNRYLSSSLIVRNSGISSSIWLGLKPILKELISKVCWIVGEDSKINFWNENWLGYSILDKVEIDDEARLKLHATIKNFRCNNSWCLPLILEKKTPGHLP